MKKTIFFVLTFTLTVIFCFPGQLKGTNKKRFLIEKHQPGAIQTITPKNAREKRERYLWLKKQRQEWASQCPVTSQVQSTDTPSALDINIQLVDGSVYLQPDDSDSGYVCMTGICTNTGSDQAFFVFVSVEFLDGGGASLGTDVGMAVGGRNVQVVTDNGILCLDTLVDGDKGFFQVWSDDVPFSEVAGYEETFYWGYSEVGNLDPANAQLSIDGDLQYKSWEGNKLKVTANVKNSSPNYGSAYTAVFLAVFDSDNKRVLDVNANYAGDTSSPGYNWAVYPLETETVDIFYQFARNNGQVGDVYRAGFWYYEGTLDIAGDTEAPIGSFDTPVDGAVVSGSIAVTGWALDDIGLKSVKIYREEGGGLVYLGDANFLEGARTDVENNPLFASYPNKSKAGWGYMLLTNFLPGGDGTFVLHAIATDLSGKSTTLGIKTIICDNANAVKPFGAIDSPQQGGVAYGSKFIVWGWALTPQPDSIPIDGSTINVWVDGVNLGHPTYNIHRADIAALFPGYANTDGAAGYFVLDTTAYEDGVHTIQWTVMDSGGDTDGIGSRYFNITNGGVDTEF